MSARARVCVCVCVSAKDNCDKCSQKRSSSVVVKDLSLEVFFGGDIVQLFVLGNSRECCRLYLRTRVPCC